MSLYSSLVGGAAIDEAVTSARRLLHGTARFGTEWATPVLTTRVRGPAAPIVPRTDDDVRFTVARPAGLRAMRWETMLVLAHRGDRYVGERGETVDPQAEAEARIHSLFGADVPERTTVASAGAIPRGTELVVDADVPGVETVVRDSPLTWSGDLAEVLVQVRAPATLVGRSVAGWVRVFSGPLLVAEAEVHFAVVADGAPIPPAPAPAAMRRFRRVFPCFSPADAELVRGLAATAAALGDVEYVEGVLDHDGTAPDDWMVPALGEADVFQLFWSTSSMTSTRCRRQWEAAVALDRPRLRAPAVLGAPDAPGSGPATAGARRPAVRRHPPACGRRRGHRTGRVGAGRRGGRRHPRRSTSRASERLRRSRPTAAPPLKSARRPPFGVAALSLLGGIVGLVARRADDDGDGRRRRAGRRDHGQLDRAGRRAGDRRARRPRPGALVAPAPALIDPAEPCGSIHDDERRAEDVRRRGPDVAGRQGSPPGVDVRHGVGARPAAGLRRPAGPHGAGDVGRAAAALAGPAGAGQPVGADVGRRPRLRHRQPRPPHRPAEARLDAPAARPGLAVHRATRSTAPGRCGSSSSSRACAAARRRSCRRCTTRSPTARAACRCRCSSSTSSATPPPRPPYDPDAADVTPPPPPAIGHRDDPRHAGRRLPPADRHRQAGQRAARRPDGDPGRRRRHGGHHPRRPPAALRRRPGPLAAVDRSFAAPPLRGRAGAVPGHQGRRQAPRRHAEHGVHDRRRRRRRRATTPTSARRSSTCARRWPSAPARRRRTPTPSRWPG